MITNDTPDSTAFLAIDQLAIEPVLLLGAHKRATGVVVNIVDVVGVVVYEIPIRLRVTER